MAGNSAKLRCITRFLRRTQGIRSSQALSSSRVLNINMLVKSRPTIGFRCFSTTHIKLTQETTDSSKFDVTDEDDFEKKVLKSVLPVVVDFHAEWCGPCKTLGPKIEEAVEKHAGELLLAKVDIDENAEIAMKYKIQVVPTVFGIRYGKIVSEFKGNVSDSELEIFLQKLLK